MKGGEEMEEVISTLFKSLMKVISPKEVKDIKISEIGKMFYFSYKGEIFKYNPRTKHFFIKTGGKYKPIFLKNFKEIFKTIN